MYDISDLERIIHFGTQSEGLILSSFSFSSGLEGNETWWWTWKFAVCHKFNRRTRDEVVGGKLAEGNWHNHQSDPWGQTTFIKVFEFREDSNSREINSLFVTKAWWSFKDGWDFTLNLFNQPPLSACFSLCWKHYQQSGKTVEVDKIQNKSDTMEPHSMYFNGKQTSTHIHYFHSGILWALHYITSLISDLRRVWLVHTKQNKQGVTG